MNLQSPSRKLILTLTFLIVAASMVMMVAAQTEGERNVAFVLDASGSMQAELEGRTRMAVAQDAVISLSGRLSPTTNASLWVYGHRLPQSDPAASCMDIEQVIPLGPADPAEFESVVSNLSAIGYTPISSTLQQAAGSLPPDGNNTIVLVSDGEETCEGNPCAVAESLAVANVDLVVNTIGFAADDATRQQLQCIAGVTNGIYIDAKTEAELNQALEKASAAPATVRIVDPDGNVLNDIPFSVTSVDTGAVVGTFSGIGSIPAGGHTVNVRAEPPITQDIVAEPEDVIDIIVTPVTTGTIELVDLQGNPLPELTLAVFDGVTGEGLGARNGTFEVPAGDYLVEVRTLIRSYHEATVVAGEVTQIVIDTSAGTIMTVDLDGNPISGIAVLIVDAATGNRLSANGRGEWEVPPGTYDLEVRTQIPFEVQVTVTAGEVVTVPVDTSKGTIITTDLDGNPISGIVVLIVDADGNRISANGSGEWEVDPGVYDLEVRTQIPYDVQVTVVADEVVEVPVDTAKGTIRTVDTNGNPVQGIAVLIVDADGNRISANGSGEWEVDPGVYDLEVRTQIPYDVQVTVVANEVVEVPIDTAKGTIMTVDLDGNPISGIAVLIVDADGNRISANGSGEWEVDPGVYDLEVRTQIPFDVQVTVVANEVVEVPIDTAKGTIITTDLDGNPISGIAVLIVDADGNRISANGSGEWEVDPGVYDLEVRTQIPFDVQVTVVADETVTVPIDTASATIISVDADGNRIDGVVFVITHVETGMRLHANGRGEWEVPPGDYLIEIRSDETYEESLTVADGDVIEVIVR